MILEENKVDERESLTKENEIGEKETGAEE